GEAAQQAIRDEKATQHGIANDAYGRLRQLEADSLKDFSGEVPAQLPPDRAGHFTLPEPKALMSDAAMDDFLKRHGGTNTAPQADWRTAPLNQAIPTRPLVPMVTDLSSLKSVVGPMAKELAAKKAVTGALVGDDARAATLFDSILTGPQHVPLSVADGVLSDMKR